MTLLGLAFVCVDDGREGCGGVIVGTALPLMMIQALMFREWGSSIRVLQVIPDLLATIPIRWWTGVLS